MNCLEFCADSSVFKYEIVFRPIAFSTEKISDYFDDHLSDKKQSNSLYQFSSQISITGYEGNRNFVSIPKYIDDLPVTTISAKAFLGQRQIEIIELPDLIIEIGDWAFSHLKNLKKVVFPTKEITFGKQIFQDCESLVELPIRHCMDLSLHDNISYYGVALFQYMKNSLLFNPHTMGQPDWYQDFDQEVLRFLNRPDGEDFEPVILGWFNDEDYMETQYPAHVKEVQGVKARLALMRLRYPIHLDKDTQLHYESYVSSHIDEGVWDTLLSPVCINDLEYLRIVLDMNGIDETHADDCMHDLVRLNASEAVVLLMEYKDSHFKKDDFFDGLAL